MAVELGVVCPEIPDSEQVSRLIGPLMSMILRCEMVHALADEGNDGWTVHWGTASAVVDLLPPGKHEFGESWFLNVAPGERGMDLSLLLAIVAAASAATAVDGRVLDESSLVGGGNIGGGELLRGLQRPGAVGHGRANRAGKPYLGRVGQRFSRSWQSPRTGITSHFPGV